MKFNMLVIGIVCYSSVLFVFPGKITIADVSQKLALIPQTLLTPLVLLLCILRDLFYRLQHPSMVAVLLVMGLVGFGCFA